MSKDNIIGGPEDRAEYEDETVPAALELDVAKYLPEMEGFDMTEAQKIEMLQVLWEIMRAFVELGFTTDICGQIFENPPEDPESGPGNVGLPAFTTMEKPSTASGKDISV